MLNIKIEYKYILIIIIIMSNNLYYHLIEFNAELCLEPKVNWLDLNDSKS